MKNLLYVTLCAVSLLLGACDNTEYRPIAEFEDSTNVSLKYVIKDGKWGLGMPANKEYAASIDCPIEYDTIWRAGDGLTGFIGLKEGQKYYICKCVKHEYGAGYGFGAIPFDRYERYRGKLRVYDHFFMTSDEVGTFHLEENIEHSAGGFNRARTIIQGPFDWEQWIIADHDVILFRQNGLWGAFKKYHDESVVYDSKRGVYQGKYGPLLKPSSEVLIKPVYTKLYAIESSTSFEIGSEEYTYYAGLTPDGTWEYIGEPGHRIDLPCFRFNPAWLACALEDGRRYNWGDTPHGRVYIEHRELTKDAGYLRMYQNQRYTELYASGIRVAMWHAK